MAAWGPGSLEVVGPSTSAAALEPPAPPQLELLVAAPPLAVHAERTGAEGRYVRWVKPLLDFVVGLALLLVLLPIMFMVAATVRAHLGPGIIYRQRRVGLGGVPFTMYKFRTMRPDRRVTECVFAEHERRVCHKRDDDPRHTPLGRVLRRWSLDELPQLWNVLLGHMSLVGPRPELVAIVDRYDAWQHRRHEVRPGITGFWQVSDRERGLACEKVDLDIAYLHKVSFWTDCAVLARTVPAVLNRGGR